MHLTLLLQQKQIEVIYLEPTAVAVVQIDQFIKSEKAHVVTLRRLRVVRKLWRLLTPVNSGERPNKSNIEEA